ncbi:UTRA domain-containing protein [Trebonia sp.]|uniref:UTRA domain-containing protein n=1 Tax=Trebonia sp. TaxID=2767075 RepID=UPI002605C205|nr:UTRA domain-containing protein [Trebonia sp.]
MADVGVGEERGADPAGHAGFGEQPGGTAGEGVDVGGAVALGGPALAELAQPEDTTRENILAEAGYEQVYDIDEIITRMPTPEETRRLGIAAGTPVAEHIRTGYTAADKPVRVMISIIPGDTLILQYTIPT